jgi:predicted PurR-regulated permease PerM
MKSLEFFVNPVPALAIAGMAVNDHWLKRAYPSWITGKISDFLGVFYFPLFLCAIVCVAENLVEYFLSRRRDRSAPTRRTHISAPMMLAAMAVTALLLIAVKTSPTISNQIESFFNEHLFRVKMTPDPTDLIALTSLIASYIYARRFFGHSEKLVNSAK